MPFTPFHLGPGLLLKSAAPRHVSFIAFAATQVAVDLEPLYFILRGEYPVHRSLHTVWGGGAVGLAVGAAVWAVARRRAVDLGPTARADVERTAALVGGLLGGVSHPLLDGLMHQDVRALRPLAEIQWVMAPGGVAPLHVSCLVAGLVGLVILLARRRRA